MPFIDVDACLLDPAMAARYPDAATRQRICAGMLARAMPRRDSISIHRIDDESLLSASKVSMGPSIAILHDCIAAREGTNGRGEFKPWEALKEGASSMEGVPLTYGHPKDRQGVIVEVRPEDGVGFAVNVRADEALRAIRYDAVLFLQSPPQFPVAAQDLERNRLLADFVAAGGVVDNSVGYWTQERKESGTYQGEPFDLVQEEIRFGHVAILKPFTPETGACSAPDGCGIGLDHEGGCKGGEGCCKTRMEKAVQDIMQDLGVSRLVALQLVKNAE